VAVLEILQAQTQPTSLAALASMTGAHPNTVREHLEGLRLVGLARRSPAPASGRGRPGWLYEATERSHDDPRPEYAGLAVALASVVARTSPAPAEDAREAGIEWGRQLAESAQTGSSTVRPRTPRRAVSDLFDQMGFGAEPGRGARVVRLTRCPLLEAAHQAPEIVCSVHQGIAEGALEEFGAPSDGVRLLPFAEPGACLLRLRATP
jgi:predicted ArsR family transcriptional regulator